MSFSTNLKQELLTNHYSDVERNIIVSVFLKRKLFLNEDGEHLSGYIRINNITLFRLFLKLLRKFTTTETVSKTKPGVKHPEQFFISLYFSNLTSLNEKYFFQKPEGVWWQKKVYQGIPSKIFEKAYLIGVFLAHGNISVSSQWHTHLEIRFKTPDAADFFCKITHKYNLNFHVLKFVKNSNSIICYLKRGLKIADFFKLIGANNAVMLFESERIYRDTINSITRLNNIDIHNQHLSIMTGLRQVKEIEFLKKIKQLHLLNQKVQRLAKLRLVFPEQSFLELATKYNKKYNMNITKSAVYHWFNQIHSCFLEKQTAEPKTDPKNNFH